MVSQVELMNLFWSSSGVYPGESGISRFDFKDRVISASRAGFKGIGIWLDDLEHTNRHIPLRDMKAILDDYGMKYVELEFLTDWFISGEKKSSSDVQRKKLLEASAALQAKHIKVGDFANTPCPLPKIAESFAALCEEAREYGAVIGFEFMASAMIHDLPSAIAMVEMAGAANGGLVLDIAHFVELGMPFEDIHCIPLRYLINVELNDGHLKANPSYDPANRMFCGEGAFDIKGFIHAVRQAGYAGPWAVEVFSRSLAGLPLDESNARAFDGAMAQFVD